MKRVAVVILNWNGEELLKKYLPQVVVNTDDRQADIVVVDNGSTDGSREVIKDFIGMNLKRSPRERIKTLFFDKNYGFAGGYNRAIEQLDYEYVVLLNSDVAPSDGWLGPLIELMDGDKSIVATQPKILDDKEHEKFEYAGAGGGYLDCYGYPFCRGRIFDTIEADEGQYDDSCAVAWASGACLLVRRDVYLAVGGLDEDFFAHMEEIDLCWRLWNSGYRVYACGSSEVYHLGGGSLSKENSRKTYLNFRNNLLMIVKNHHEHTFLLILTRLMLDGVAAIRYLLSGKMKFFTAIIRAHFSFYGLLRSSLHKRKSLKNNNLIGKNILQPYSIVWQYFVKHKKKFSLLQH